MSGSLTDSGILARAYRARGWKPVPIEAGRKGPTLRGWQEDDHPDEAFRGNVGVQLGRASGGLVDVDLDRDEAVRAAAITMSHAPGFGRASRPASHRLFRVTGEERIRTRKLSTRRGSVVLELRGCGAQTVFPGSAHPLGEAIEWTDGRIPGEREVPEIGYEELLGLCRATLLLAVCLERYPAAGSRDELCLALGGALLRMGVTPDTADEWVTSLASAAGDEESDRRGKAWRTHERLEAGEATTGLPTVLERLAVDEDVADLLRRECGGTPTGDLARDDKGRPHRTAENVRRALAHLGVTLEHDEFSRRSLARGLEGFGPRLDDPTIGRLWLLCEERHGLSMGKDKFWTIVEDEALNARRHPVREYLDSLEWDGQERVETWLTRYLGVEATEYSAAVGALWLVASMRRARRPGCKFDEMLVIEGPQGSSKSSVVETLVPTEEWFSDDLPLNASGKEVIEATEGRWIIEASDLAGMRQSDVENLKSFLSRRTDKARLAYGRTTTERPRQFVLVGTTNSDQYLRDGTGNRRFWPVQTGEIDLAALRRDRDQLWAEAATLEAEGASIRLDPALYPTAAEEQEDRRVEDPIVVTLASTLGDLEGVVRTRDLFRILGIPPGQQSQSHSQRIGQAMRALGWRRTKRRFGGPPESAYVRTSTGRTSPTPMEMRLTVDDDGNVRPEPSF